MSPPLVPDGENQLDCYLVNVGDRIRSVRIQALTKNGVPVATVDAVLPPGHEEVARAGANDLPRYCRFVVEGPKADFRASVLVRQEGVGSISALPAQ